MSDSDFVSLDFQRLDPAEMIARSREFADDLARRRSVRHFKSDPVPGQVLEDCIRCAGTAPSGAHQQPWTFVVVSDPELKRKIRAAAEEEERVNYGGRLNAEWLAALAPLGTDANKEFLEVAPALIVLFRKAHGVDAGSKVQYYYTHESIGIALGFLLAALHRSGLATLTHTPSPMKFLEGILGRPSNERAYMLIPVGYPTDDCEVPDLVRKPLSEIREWHGPGLPDSITE